MNREENKISAEKKAKDKKLNEINQRMYSDSNILSKRKFETANGDKIKIIEEVKFKNGAIKRKIVGMKIKGRVIWENKTVEAK
jgi:hypothetical protein